MIDEKSRRTPAFSEGYPVTLTDGQTWFVPKARYVFRPRFVDGKVELAGGATFGPESDGELEILYGTVDADGPEILRVKFAMAVRLLRVNYELSDDELAELLVLEYDDPASDERWTAMTNAVMGVRPKPSPAI